MESVIRYFWSLPDWTQVTILFVAAFACIMLLLALQEYGRSCRQ